jgi:hypothetical protein
MDLIKLPGNPIVEQSPCKCSHCLRIWEPSLDGCLLLPHVEAEDLRIVVSKPEFGLWDEVIIEQQYLWID